MKLHLSVLKRIIDLPDSEPQKVRQLLDELGLEVKEVLTQGSDLVFNIETLANRGDHLYALGIGREISARLLTALKVPPSVNELPPKQASLPIRVLTDRCPRYSLMEMAFPPSFVLPSEVRDVMAPAGDKHPIVDLLNYVQLEIGQPMHAFDKDKLEGEVAIVLSDKEEEVQALDGKSYKVPSGSILIRDRKKIIAVAGVIGCSNSMVGSSTQRVLIESASFDPVSVRLTARKMGISTDASYVFERGCDLEAVNYSLRRVAYLAQGSRGSTSTESQAHVLGASHFVGRAIEKRAVTLALKTLRQQMNLARLQESEVIARLKNLGYQVSKEDELIVCQVPSWRLWDVRYEEDLIEDFVRSHGFNNVKLSLPPIDEDQAPLNALEQLLSKVEPILLGNGFNEVITDSFYSNQEVKLLEEFLPQSAEEHLRITNSIESSITHMRLTNIINLARLASFNARKGVLSFKVFEIAKLFAAKGINADPSDDEYPFERDVLCLGFYGRWYDNEFGKPESSELALRRVQGVIDALAAALGSITSYTHGEIGVLHPGKQAEISVGRKSLGFFGSIHPLMAERLDLKGDFIYAELDVETLLSLNQERIFIEPSELPSIRRDITLKLKQQDFAAHVVDKIQREKPSNLVDVTVIDNFQRADEDFRRVTYRLTFQDRERTLESAEVDTTMQNLISRLAENHKLELAN